MASWQSEADNTIEDFLGSTRIFALALENVLEARLLSELGASQLTSAQIKTLSFVCRAGAQTIGDVAAFLSISDAAASKAVDRLVRRGLLRRTEREADRRTSELAPTTEGKSIVAEYERIRQERLAGVFSEFVPGELRSAACLLERLAASIVTHNANPEEVCLQCGVHLKERCPLQDIRRTCSYRKRVRTTSGVERGEES